MTISTSSGVSVAAVIALLFPVGVLLRGAAQVPAAPAEPKSLAERVEVLEKTVSQNLLEPDQTLLARMAAVEQKLKLLEKPATPSARDLDQWRKSLESVQATTSELERRLRTVEQKAQGAEVRDLSYEVHDLRRDLNQLSRTVEDLRGQLSRLPRR